MLYFYRWMDGDVLNTLTPKMISNRPNTYTYTKAIAEYLLYQNKEELPVVIFRPSIVGASWNEPVPVSIHNLILIILSCWNKGIQDFSIIFLFSCSDSFFVKHKSRFILHYFVLKWFCAWCFRDGLITTMVLQDC